MKSYQHQTKQLDELAKEMKDRHGGKLFFVQCVVQSQVIREGKDFLPFCYALRFDE